MNYSLIRTDGSHPGFLSLIYDLDKELRSYDSDHDEVYITQNVVPPDVYVSLIMQGDLAVGCACLRDYKDGDIELKRMYVLPGHRGKGLSRRILDDMEHWARELGKDRIVLETGLILNKAVSLYKSAGYEKIANYGHYEEIEESICFAKKVSL